MRRKPGTLVPLEASVLVVAAELLTRGVTEIHGYDLATHLAERTHARLLTSHGTLYRALSRLESMGLLDSRWEVPDRDDSTRPPRRLYRLTDAGAQRARSADADVDAARAVRMRDLGEAPA
jgi:DNA-binding PadR family transcriptional regulator